MIEAAHALLAVASGGIVGFSLGLVGGGGSILAVPLLVYVVGISDPHVAIGTSALAVAVSAFANLLGHWRVGTVKWPCAIVFAVSGIIGALIGSSLGKLVEGQRLLFLFALVMIVMGGSMLLPRMATGGDDVRLNPPIAVRLIGIGLIVGGISGFFGIGGGFLIVPGLMLGSGMAIINAVGSSLLSVTIFGSTTAFNYALSGLIDWPVALLFVAGGFVGGLGGRKLAIRLSQSKKTLHYLFAAVIFVVAIYMLIRTGGG